MESRTGSRKQMSRNRSEHGDPGGSCGTFLRDSCFQLATTMEEKDNIVLFSYSPFKSHLDCWREGCLFLGLHCVVC